MPTAIVERQGSPATVVSQIAGHDCLNPRQAVQ